MATRQGRRTRLQKITRKNGDISGDLLDYSIIDEIFLISLWFKKFIKNWTRK